MSSKKTVGQRIIKQRDYLNLLSKSKNKKRRDGLLDLANKEEIDSVCECLLNSVHGNVQLNKLQIRQLKRQKRKIQNILRKSNSLSNKKKNIKQIGGFLTTIIPLALSALSSFLPKFFK